MTSLELPLCPLSVCCLLAPYILCANGCEIPWAFLPHHKHDVEVPQCRVCWKNAEGERGTPVLSGCCLGSVFGSEGVQGCSVPATCPECTWSFNTLTAQAWPGDHPLMALPTWTPRAPDLLLYQQPRTFASPRSQQ